MIKIEYEVYGRRFSNPRQAADALLASAFEEIGSTVAENLRGLRCPVHDSQPSVTVKGRSAESISFEIVGCCEDLIRQAEAVFS